MAQPIYTVYTRYSSYEAIDESDCEDVLFEIEDVIRANWTDWEELFHARIMAPKVYEQRVKALAIEHFEQEYPIAVTNGKFGLSFTFNYE